MMTEETDAKPVTPVAVHTRKDRTAVVKLDWPVEYDGVIYSEITIRRMTGKEIQSYFEDTNPDKRFPMFSVPNPVLDALDADDSLAVEDTAASFLPRRLLAATEKKDQ